MFPCYEQDETVGATVHEAKTPRTRRGHLDAVTDPDQIRRWFGQWPNALVGVNAGKSGLACADIDMGDDKQGNPHDGWASLIDAELEETLDTFTYQTRRGGDHFIFTPTDDRPLGPTKGHATPQGVVLDSVDRRAGSSYFIWWGDEIPASREAFKPAPEWLMTEHIAPDYSPFGGGVDEWIAKCDQGEPESYIAEIVNSIPETDFGHDVMVQLQATLVGLGADHRAGIPWALNRLREEWLRPPYDTDVFERDWNLSLNGAIEKFGQFSVPLLPTPAPAPAPAPMAPAVKVDPIDAAMRVPGDDFFQAWIGIPDVTVPGSLQQRVDWIRQTAIERGLTAAEAEAVAQGSAARRSTDWEANSAIATFPGAEPAPAHTPTEAPSKLRLLNAAERAALEGITWWGDEFMDRMAEVNAVMSEQFYRMNRWIILSLIFSNKAAIIDRNGTRTLLNFYGITLGPSGIGKSQSLNPVKGMMRAFFLIDDSPDIGGDATRAGLTRALQARDKKTSLFHSDEADGILLAWGDKLSAFAGMKQFVTDIYASGEVGPSQRSGAPELNKHAEAFMCVHLTGIDERIMDAIDPHDWETGFVNRFIWAKGYRKSISREQRLRRVSTTPPDGQSQVQKWYAAWAGKFRNISGALFGEPGSLLMGGPVGMEIDADVLEREADLWERFEELARKSAHPERLRPTFERLWSTVMKCAALVAITEKRLTIQMSDYLIALEQAEEWTQNALEMVDATDESPRSRQANRLADLIRANGGEMRRGEIHSKKIHAGKSKDTNDLINELVEQGRVEILPVAKNPALAIVRLMDLEAAA